MPMKKCLYTRKVPIWAIFGLFLASCQPVASQGTREARPSGEEVSQQAGERAKAADRDELILYSSSISEEDARDEDADHGQAIEPADEVERSTRDGALEDGQPEENELDDPVDEDAFDDSDASPAPDDGKDSEDEDARQESPRRELTPKEKADCMDGKGCLRPAVPPVRAPRQF